MNHFLHVSSGFEDKERTLAGLRITIGNRVRRVCLNMTEPEFAEMVDAMAHVHLKYETLA